MTRTTHNSILCRRASSSVWLVVLLLIAGLGGCADEPLRPSPLDQPAAQEPEITTEKFLRSAPGAVLVSNSYIVVFDEHVANSQELAAEMAARYGLTMRNIYTHAIKGYAALIPKGKIDSIASDPRVAYIQQDQVITTTVQTPSWGIAAIAADVSTAQSGNGSGSVTGVEIYIIDTGIDFDHPDLNVVDSVNYTTDPLAEDGHGHGTHVGGITAAIDNANQVVGVAPGAPLFGVKVLKDSGWGYSSWVIAGIDYVSGRKATTPGMPMVANLSLGGPADSALDQSIEGCVNAGVVVVVAAGNSNIDASNSSPARAPSGITVGAYASNNALAGFSNYGKLIDINAPGVGILSTYKNGGMASLSGTSMAAPYVAGSAALYLSNPLNASKSPLAVRNQLVVDARTVVVHSKIKTTTRGVYVATY